MSRILPGAQSSSHRPLVSVLAGLAAAAAVAACGGTTGTTTASTSSQEQALTEARSSYADARLAADACFATFEACKSAADADWKSCRDALHACLPEAAGPGPHCGGDGGGGRSRGGRRGDEGEGGERPSDGPARDCDGGGPAPPPGGGPRGGDHPDFCNHVPLPPSAELQACHGANDACIAGGSDRKTCFDEDRACVKAAFDAAFATLCAATDKDERLTKLCAGGVAPGG